MASQTITPVKTEPNRPVSSTRRTIIGICFLLAVGVAIAYYPVLGNDFVNFDDPDYVAENEWVKQGLTWAGFQWAFNLGHAGNWHPLTWLSHMLDCQLFGLNAGLHHCTSGLFHLANTLLLFALLRGITGALWRSAGVAALFALHPLHVESVAWLSERKDVLSTFFGLLCLISYARYARSKIEGQAARFPYALALGFYALGLMSKPMLVTWPLLMLILDFWPLQRVTSDGWRLNGKTWVRLIREKVPFFALAIVSSIVTFLAQKAGGAVAGFSALPLLPRVQNAILTYAAYLRQMLWPVDLAAYYPFPEALDTVTVVLAGLVLATVSVLVWHYRRQRPYLLFGWLWYLVMLVPVIGLVQVGFQARADRYTYLSLTGPFLMLVWGVAEVAARWRRGILLSGIVTASVLIIGTALTRTQVGYWKNSETLHRHTLAVTSRNPTTHLNLGSALLMQGRAAEAADQFQAALAIRGDYAEAQSNLGFALVAQGYYDEGITWFRSSLRLKPHGKTYFLLGNVLNRQGETAAAILEYRRALAVDPNQVGALNDLAWVLATDADAGVRNGTEAVQLAERANQVLGRQEPMFLGTLAAAYAEVGRFNDAIRVGERARELADRNGLKELAGRNAQLIEEYRAGRAHREPAAAKSK